MTNKSKVLKAQESGWETVEKKVYKTDSSSFKSVSRYSLLTDDFPELNFHTRYFEIEPGGFSSLEQHRHPHSVIILNGCGSVLLNNEIQKVDKHDAIFIAPNTIHQFYADRNHKLGFICIVDRYRDKPVIPADEEIRKIITSDEVLKKIRK